MLGTEQEHLQECRAIGTGKAPSAVRAVAEALLEPCEKRLPGRRMDHLVAEFQGRVEENWQFLSEMQNFQIPHVRLPETSFPGQLSIQSQQLSSPPHRPELELLDSARMHSRGMAQPS